MSRTPLTALLLAALLVAGSAPATAKERLTVLLDWFVNPDHGPLIVAQEKGMFEAAGLSVSLIEPADPNLPPKLVAAGKAELAISYQPQLHMLVAEGLPLVRVATLVATPLNSLVALRDGPVKGIADLKGRKVGYSIGGFEDALLGRMLETHGLTLKDVELVNVNFALSPALMSGQVDAVIGAFRNFELNQLDLEKRPGRAFYPEEEGVPAYDELIVVTNRALLTSDAIARFVKVLEAATQYIVNHPDEAWEVFRASAPKKLDNELNRRAWRDTVARFALRPAALDRGRYVRFGAFLRQRGLVETLPKVETYAVELE
ncbi:MAG: ABC transporter substrate-binding protein [Alphaproteobacteria bacterium]|nr:ABC transporter substrate-binding protein [Alphaproteobacteria bacterium]